LSMYSHLCVISSCRREVDEHCAIVGYYAASSGNYLPTRVIPQPVVLSITTTRCIRTQKSAAVIHIRVFHKPRPKPLLNSQRWNPEWTYYVEYILKNCARMVYV
jgi:hypothetical protein